MTSRRCVIKSCQSRKNLENSLFSFPKHNPELCKLWSDLCGVPVNRLETTERYVCGKHFHLKFLTRKKRVKRFAYPEIGLDLDSKVSSDIILKYLLEQKKIQSIQPQPPVTEEKHQMIAMNTECTDDYNQDEYKVVYLTSEGQNYDVEEVVRVECFMENNQLIINQNGKTISKNEFVNNIQQTSSAVMDVAAVQNEESDVEIIDDVDHLEIDERECESVEIIECPDNVDDDIIAATDHHPNGEPAQYEIYDQDDLIEETIEEEEEEDEVYLEDDVYIENYIEDYGNENVASSISEHVAATSNHNNIRVLNSVYLVPPDTNSATAYEEDHDDGGMDYNLSSSLSLPAHNEQAVTNINQYYETIENYTNFPNNSTEVLQQVEQNSISKKKKKKFNFLDKNTIIEPDNIANIIKMRSSDPNLTDVDKRGIDILNRILAADGLKRKQFKKN